MLMKKRVGLLAVAGLLIAASGVAVASGASGEYNGHPIVNVVVNGKTVQGEVPGINMEGTTLVPLKVVSEALGAQVSWDQATSTASVTTSAAAESPGGNAGTTSITPENAEKRRLALGVRDLYGKVQAYMEQLPTIREKIRIAKEYYDIKKSDQYFKPMNDMYWKELEDTYLAILYETSSSEMNAAKTKDILSPEFMDLLKTVHSSMTYYQYAVDHFTRYVSTGQSQFLEFYIASYASGFDEELKAKEQYKSAFQLFDRSNPQ